MPRPILATIDTHALADNLGAVSEFARATLPGVFVWAVIKARGYGHGIEAAVRGFAQADGLALLDFDEAVQCRTLGWRKPILLLEGFFEPADLALVQAYELAIVVHCAEQLDMLESATLGRPVDAWVKLNSGMHRLGFQPAEYRRQYARALALQAGGCLGQVGKMTHFARADDDPGTTRAQLDCFRSITQGLPGPVSVCNSAATLTAGLSRTLGDGPQAVRPGVCLYGASPFPAKTAAELHLRPAMTLASVLISTHRMQAGDGLGYGHAYRAPHDMRVGIVACGYADGYPRHAPTGTPVQVAGVRTRLLGTVSMDMLAVDLEPVPQAGPGAPVVLWGEGGPSVNEVAAASATIGYELLTALAPRVPRRILPAVGSG
ncbi:alanine racemase [Castellaniella sp.]|uniref:alanine racemase n=1 Tax=Castellaniella sp. TaxID=1955812 RepID=UPI0035699465